MSADFTPTRGEYVSLTPFRYWCQKILPLTYDDSMSYYELLCKVVDYLNKAMEDVETLNTDIDNVYTAYNTLQDYVNTYFDNLDVSAEIDSKLDAMATDGTLSQLIGPFVLNSIPPIVVDETSDMVDRNKLYILSGTGHLYQWDSQLNSFSDTGLSYGTIGNVLTTKVTISGGNLNDATPNTVIGLSYPGTGYVNNPLNHPGYLVTYQFGDTAGKIQFIYDYYDGTVWSRQCGIQGNWSQWLSNTALKNNGLVGSAVTSYPYSSLRNMNLAPLNSMVTLNAPLSDGTSYVNTPENLQGSAYVMTYQWGNNENGRVQFYYEYRTGYSWHRTCDITGNWSVWMFDTCTRDGGVVGSLDTHNPYSSIRDMNDAPSNSMIALNAPLAEGDSYVNTPNNSQEPAYVFTYRWGISTNAKLQFYYNYYTGNGYYRTCDIHNNWSAWKEHSGGYTYNTVKNVTENTYNNSYNITSEPTITTDTNGWLASTNDTTDRTADIMAMLNATGYCHLGKGTFYVNGQIEMPDNSTLTGCGEGSIIKASSTNNGALIIPTNNCHINNIKVEGNGSAGSTVTGSNGALIYDTKTDYSSPSTHGYKKNVIDSVFFANFSGCGIEIRGTGGSMLEGSIITNCKFENCSIGIKLGYFTEYHKINACIVGKTNYIGIVDNGGNNSFVNCTISGSNTGFIIDNSDGTLRNEGHGSCVGCYFNHVGNNNGNGIKILGVNNGFVFSGCQWWYSGIVIDHSMGILFDGIQGGGYNKIIVSNSFGIMFDGMLLNNTPEIVNSNNTNLRFVNCYNYITGATITG